MFSDYSNRELKTEAGTKIAKNLELTDKWFDFQEKFNKWIESKCDFLKLLMNSLYKWYASMTKKFGKSLHLEDKK